VNNQAVVTLREITSETVREFCNLKVSDEQIKFVAPNAVSIAQAYFYKEAWFRGVYADDTPVGFIMLEDNREKPEYFLWRFMIDSRYQGLGYGKQAMMLFIDHVKTLPNAVELLTSCVPGEGSPQGFYEKLGFKLTGKSYDAELELKLEL